MSIKSNGTIRYANTKRTGRQRVCIWLDRRMLERVKTECFARRVSQQAIIESAVTERYSEEDQESREERFSRQFGYIRTSLQALDRELEAVAEFVGLFVKMWLASTPKIPANEREAALREAQERYDKLVQCLVRHLGSGNSIFTQLPREILDKD